MRIKYKQLLEAMNAESGELINPLSDDRCANIATFYGDPSASQVIKQCLGRIAKGAKILRQQNPGAQHVNDQDIGTVSKRIVNAHAKDALERPTKRRQLHDMKEGESLPESQVLPGFSPDGLPNGGNQGFRAVIGPPRSLPPQLNSHGSRDSRESSMQQEFRIPPAPRELTSASTDPSYIPSPIPPVQEAPQSRVPPKKRPCKEVSECDLDYQTISSSSQSGSRRTQEPTSFGYVSDAGFFRCALCFSQLSSQDALDKHEALSKLHQRNLQDPAIISKGRAKLAQVIALPQQSSASPAAFRPLGLGAFSERGEPITNGHLARNGASRSDLSHTLDQPPRCQEILANPSRNTDTIEVLRRMASAPHSQISLSVTDNGNFHASEMKPVEGMGVGKGKQRASPYPAAATQTYTLAPSDSVLQAPTPVDEAQFQRPNAVDSAPNEAEDSTSRTAPTMPQNINAPSRLHPVDLEEILQCVGETLLRNYISKNPDRINEIMSRRARTMPHNINAPSRLHPVDLEEILQCGAKFLVVRFFSKNPDLNGKIMSGGQREPTAKSTASVSTSGDMTPTRGSTKDVQIRPDETNGGRGVDVVILD